MGSADATKTKLIFHQFAQFIATLLFAKVLKHISIIYIYFYVTKFLKKICIIKISKFGLVKSVALKFIT